MSHAPTPKKTQSVAAVAATTVAIIVAGFFVMTLISRLMAPAPPAVTERELQQRQELVEAYSLLEEQNHELTEYMQLVKDLQAENERLKERLNQLAPVSDIRRLR